MYGANEKTFGEALRDHRADMRLSLRAFGKLTGVSHVYVCDLENGKRGCSLAQAERFAREAGASWLVHCWYVGRIRKLEADAAAMKHDHGVWLTAPMCCS